MTSQEFLLRLKGVHGAGRSKWIALCPAHRDVKASLSVAESGGKILLHDFAGCTTEAILTAMGLTMSDLFADSNGHKRGKRRIVTAYPYTDEKGEVLFEVVRYEPKSFRQRRPDGQGGWIWNLNGVRRVLYCLPEIIEAKSVLIVEGERDVETAWKLGLTATCNPGGSMKWEPEFTEVLRGKRVVVICDADPPGLAHGRAVARSLIGVAASVQLITALPQAKDLTEYVENGGTCEKLMQIIEETPALTVMDITKWKNGKAADGFTLTPLGDLLARPDVPVDYVLENMLVTGTVSIVVAKPKVGKSTFSRNLCLAISRGDKFLGLNTKKGECLYLALEERGEDVRNDFRAMGASGDEPIFIHAASAPAEGIKALCELIDNRRPVLMVVDPLFRIVHVRDEKAYAENYAALGPLIDAARIVGTHILLCHHGGKSLKADPIDSPLGSTAIGGAVSTVVVLKRTERYRTVQTIQRVGRDLPETVLQFDAESRRLSVAGTRFEADRQDCEAAILEFLKGAGEPQTQVQVRDGVEVQTRIVRAALTALVEAGKVIKSGDGTKGKPFFYEFPNSGSQHISGTRKPESEKVAQTSMDIGPILVPEKKPADSEAEDGEISL